MVDGGVPSRFGGETGDGHGVLEIEWISHG